MNDKELLIEEDEEPNFGSGYNYTVYYSIWDSESLEIGDTDEKGTEIEDEHIDSVEVLIDQLKRYDLYRDMGTSFAGSGEPEYLIFENETPSHDRDYFEKGKEKYYTVYVKKDNGKDFSEEEMNHIKRGLGIRNDKKRSSMNEFKYNTYEEAVEVISKLASEHDLNIEDFEFDVDNNRVILKSAADVPFGAGIANAFTGGAISPALEQNNSKENVMGQDDLTKFLQSQEFTGALNKIIDSGVKEFGLPENQKTHYLTGMINIFNDAYLKRINDLAAQQTPNFKNQGQPLQSKLKQPGANVFNLNASSEEIVKEADLATDAGQVFDQVVPGASLMGDLVSAISNLFSSPTTGQYLAEAVNLAVQKGVISQQASQTLINDITNLFAQGVEVKKQEEVQKKQQVPAPKPQQAKPQQKTPQTSKPTGVNPDIANVADKGVNEKDIAQQNTKGKIVDSTGKEIGQSQIAGFNANNQPLDASGNVITSLDTTNTGAGTQGQPTASYDMNDFNQRTAWIAQAIMALIKYGPVVLDIIKGLRSLVSDKKEEEVVTAKYSDYREAGFVDDIISSVKTLPSQIPDILNNPSTKKWISEKFNLDESTVGVISDLLKRVIDAMGSNPEEVEKEVRENPEMSNPETSPTEEKPSLISKATKYSPVATQINSNSFVLREGSEESHELEDRIIALAKMYDVEELRDIEIELSKEGEILSIRRKEAFSPISPDFGIPGWVSSLISIGSGKLINPNTSYWERGESFVAGMIGGPLGGLGYNLGKKMGHEYLGFLAGLVLQSVLNRTVLANDPKASDEDKKKADANVSDSQKQSYTYYLAMKNQNSNNQSIKLVQDKMASDKVDEETAFWRLMHDKSSEIVAAMGKTA